VCFPPGPLPAWKRTRVGGVALETPGISRLGLHVGLLHAGKLRILFFNTKSGLSNVTFVLKCDMKVVRSSMCFKKKKKLSD